MQKRQLTHLIISDPSSIDYLINYKNNPGERMYLLLLSSDGHHKLFMNNLFYLDHEIDIEQVWYSDTDNYLQLLLMNLMALVQLVSIKTFQLDF